MQSIPFTIQCTASLERRVKSNMAQEFLIDSSLSSFIKRQAESSLCYNQAWLDLITRLYGYSVFPLTTTNARGLITGFLPLCSIQSPLTGRRLVALPFFDHCPLLAEDEANANDLVNQAIYLAQEQKVRYLELRCGVNDVLAQRSDLMKGDLYVSWQLPLVSDPDAIWSGLRKPVQHQVKKSRKLGVQIRIAQTREDIERYYKLHLHTRCRKQGMPTQPRQYFMNLWDTFAAKGIMQLLLAEYQENVIAGIILFTSGRVVRYAYGASNEDYLHLAPNNLLIWAAISWGCTHGYQTLDLGRTACDNEGLMEFKRRWGAIKEPLPYYYYPHIAGLAATSEKSWIFRLLTSGWKRLPLSMAEMLGGHLYKHMG